MAQLGNPKGGASVSAACVCVNEGYARNLPSTRRPDAAMDRLIIAAGLLEGAFCSAVKTLILQPGAEAEEA
jgi:hypothetical protein